MNKIILTTLSLAAAAATSNAQIVPSQTTSGGVTTTIDCFKLDVNQATPLGTNIANGGTMTVEGNLSGGTYMPNITGYSITSFVTHFNSSGNTVASLNNGVLSFTGSVGLVTTADQLKGAKGLDKNCRTLDFSFNQCTVVDEGSALFTEIKTAQDGGSKAFYGVVATSEKGGITIDERRSASFSDVFKYNSKTKEYEYATADFKVGEKERISMYYVDARGVATEFTATDETRTDFKDFTVCVECTEKVPEPSSTALLGLGALSLLIRRKR